MVGKTTDFKHPKKNLTNEQSLSEMGRKSQIEEKLALKSMCKDKRQICRSQVSLEMTAGSKENKNTL